MRLPRPRISVRFLIVIVAILAGVMAMLLRMLDPLPPDWKLDDLDPMVRARVGLDGPGKVDLRLLAWKREEDDRPLLVDCALAWCRLESEGQTRWALLHLYRHPRDGRQWHFSMVYDAAL